LINSGSRKPTVNRRAIIALWCILWRGGNDGNNTVFSHAETDGELSNCANAGSAAEAAGANTLLPIFRFRR